MDSYVDPYELLWRHQLRAAQVHSASRLASNSAQDRHPNNQSIIDMALATRPPLDLNPNQYGMSSLIVPDRNSILREIMRREQENALKRRRDTLELSSQVHLHLVHIPYAQASISEPEMIHIMPSASLQDIALHRGAAPQAPKVDLRQDKHLQQLDRKLSPPYRSNIPYAQASISEPEMTRIVPSAALQDTALHRGAAPQAPKVDLRQDKSKHLQQLDRKLSPPYRSSSKSSTASSSPPSSVPTEAYTPPSKRAKKATDDAKKPKVAKKEATKRDDKWMVSYAQLVAYKEKYGNCVVPRGYSPNSRLASWVAEQRKQYKLLQDGKPSSITHERIQRLNSLDFAWNAQGAAWDRHMADLVRYKNEFGDCLVPLDHPDYPKLGLWVKEQRRHFTLMKAGKRSHMTDERKQALESIGFCWDTHEGIWGERLRELREYKEEYGDCIVPTSYRKHPKLSSWVHHQRRQFKKFEDGETCHITLERIRALDKLGFAWHCRYPRKNQKPRKTQTGQNQKGRSNSLESSDESESDGDSDSDIDGDSDSDSDIECDKTSESDESDTDTDFDLRPSKRQKAHSVLI